MALAPVGQAHGQQLGAFADALHLQPQELGLPIAQRLRGALAFALDAGVQLLAQRRPRDAHKAPGLHEAHAGPPVRGLQQALQQRWRHRLAGQKVPHVAPLGDGAVQRGAVGLGVAVRDVGHAQAATQLSSSSAGTLANSRSWLVTSVKGWLRARDAINPRCPAAPARRP